MGAGGTFLRVLAAGTLAVGMAAVTPPPDHHGPSPRAMDPDDPRCDVPDVTVVDGQPARIAASNETASMTLYLHSSEMYDGIRFDVVGDLSEGLMWVPHHSFCFLHSGEVWIETLSHCKEEPGKGVVTCVFEVSKCKYSCTLDVPATRHLFFSVTVFGRSLWRRRKPPLGCEVHQIPTNIHTDFNECFDYPYGPTMLAKTASTPPTTGSTPPTTASSPPITASPPPITASPPPITASPPPITASPPPITASPPPITASPPPITASPPPITASSPPITGTAPLTSAAPDRNRSWVEVEVEVAAVYAC